MSSLNQCTFVGNVGRDPELRQTTDGIPVCNFPLAVNSNTKEKETTWLKIISWRGLAEQVGKYVKKGSLVGVTGKLSVRKYTDKNNLERTAVEIIADDVRFFDRKEKESALPEPEVTPDLSEPAPAVAA